MGSGQGMVTGWVKFGSDNTWAMAKNGSSRCFFGQKRVYLETIAAKSVVGRIWLANTLFLPFLAKSVRIFGSVESRGMSHVGIPLRIIALETTPACTLLTS